MSFTENQKRVIEINSGYNIVLAGPGCGKTHILAERVARAYESGVELKDALCLTFTNRAARGMYNRICERLGDNSSELFVGNIHRYCSQFLFNNNIVPQETVIIDELEMNDINKFIIKDKIINSLVNYKIDGYTKLICVNWNVIYSLFLLNNIEKPKSGKIQSKKYNRIVSGIRTQIVKMSYLIFQLLNDFPEKDLLNLDLWQKSRLIHVYPTLSILKEKCLSLIEADVDIDTLGAEELYLYYALQYIKYKERHSMIDFEDLLLQTYMAYRDDTDKKFKRYKWVQLDEVQDLSDLQITLVDYFTDTSDNFVTVYFGDEQQAIYSFMGASLNTLTYLKNRCGCIIRLDKNFRSPKYLLDLYNDYAIKVLGTDKELLPEPKDETVAGRYDVCLQSYKHPKMEKDRVKNILAPYLKNTQKGNERTAILVPWNNDAEEISNSLKNNGITHFKISGLDSFKTISMRMLIAHLNIVNNEFNIVSWARILHTSNSVDKISDGYRLVEEMRKIALNPVDLLREDKSSYILDFCRDYEERDIVVFDTETTGLDIANDDIIQIAAVRMRGGEIVPNSSFNVYLETDKEIPQYLGSRPNPMYETHKNVELVPRYKGLLSFLEYIGNDVLLGHNVNYDYNILKYNLKRESLAIPNYIKTIDSLKLAKLLFPRLIKYKLEYLLERFDLNGNNSHMADEDVNANVSLVKLCYNKASGLKNKQRDFLNNNELDKVREELSFQYKECYWHTKNIMYELANDDFPVLCSEMKYSYDYLVASCELSSSEIFYKYILPFLEKDVVNLTQEQNMLSVQFSNHLMDISTYRESDLCDSTVMTDKLYVSTIHKAKGLEFENVVVMRADDGRFPKFSSSTEEQIDEDKRLFYVAISRAMKRLIVTSGFKLTYFVDDVGEHFCWRKFISDIGDLLVYVEIKNYEMCLVYTSNNEIVKKYVYKNLDSTGMSIREIFDLFDLNNVDSYDPKKNIDDTFSKWEGIVCYDISK